MVRLLVRPVDCTEASSARHEAATTISQCQIVTLWSKDYSFASGYIPRSVYTLLMVLGEAVLPAPHAACGEAPPPVYVVQTASCMIDSN